MRGGQTFSKAVGVLRLLAEADNGHTFTSLVLASGQPKATLHRLLGALLEERLIRYHDEDRRYRMGYGFLELAGLALSRLEIRVAAGDGLAALGRTSGETVFMAILDGAETVVVDAIDARRAGSSSAPPVGKRQPACLSAAGKTLLAGLDQAELDRLLDGITPSTAPTICSRSELAAQLSLIRRNGFLSEDQDEDDTCSLAAAVFDHRSRATGAIAVKLKGPRNATRRIAGLARMVTAASAEITLKQGGHPPPAVRSQVAASPTPAFELTDTEPSWLPEGDVPC